MANRCANSDIHLCAAEDGRDVIVGFIRTTPEFFQIIRAKLVGPAGILGPGASVMASRRVSFSETQRRNLDRAIRLYHKGVSSIEEYLYLLRHQFLVEKFCEERCVSVRSYSVSGPFYGAN